jgi:hypothetical protein
MTHWVVLAIVAGLGLLPDAAGRWDKAAAGATTPPVDYGNRAGTEPALAERRELQPLQPTAATGIVCVCCIDAGCLCVVTGEVATTRMY